MELYDENPEKKRYASREAMKSGFVTFVGFMCLAVAIVLLIPHFVR